jgi:hypothetical protein
MHRNKLVVCLVLIFLALRVFAATTADYSGDRDRRQDGGQTGEKADEVMDIRITDSGRQLLARTKRFALAGYLGLLFLIVNTGKFKTRKSEDFGSFKDDILGLLY